MSTTIVTAAQRAEGERRVADTLHSGEMEGLPSSEATKDDAAITRLTWMLLMR